MVWSVWFSVFAAAASVAAAVGGTLPLSVSLGLTSIALAVLSIGERL
jgi:hypothetical protein